MTHNKIAAALPALVALAAGFEGSKGNLTITADQMEVCQDYLDKSERTEAGGYVVSAEEFCTCVNELAQAQSSPKEDSEEEAPDHDVTDTDEDKPVHSNKKKRPVKKKP